MFIQMQYKLQYKCKKNVQYITPIHFAIVIGHVSYFKVNRIFYKS